MRSLLLLGDSIRLSYQPYVAALLGDRFKVVGPPENGESSRNMLRRVDSWLQEFDAAVIHVNCGLHDLRHDPGSTGPQVDVTEYEENLERLFSILQERTSARLIWATITPINERLHAARNASTRVEADVTRYNDAGLRAATASGIQINDLYGAMVAEGLQKFFQDDGVHFTAPGYEFLASRVVEAVDSSTIPSR